MRTATLFIIIGILSFLAGISATWLVLERNIQFNRLTFGVWNIWPVAGEPTADPYSRALFARRGSVWMGTTEGVALVAAVDESGSRLKTSCRYRFEGSIPRARLWTLTAETLRSTPEGTAAENYSFITSNDVIWRHDKMLEIAISKDPYPGNWLELPDGNDFQLVLRLYDTPLSSNILTAKIDVPALKKEHCS